MSVSNWCCAVCGYLHSGDSPPDCCPLCGATPDLFEAAAAAPAIISAPPSRWRCLNCDYIHAGGAPPARCPVCGVSSERFEPLDLDAAAPQSSETAGEIVIVGGGIAGLSAAEAARATAPMANITLLAKETELPYYRLNLTRYINGEISAEELSIHPKSWYEEHRISLRSGVEVTHIDPARRLLSLKGGGEVGYDRLVLALGAHPFVPPIPGANRENIFTLRTLADADRVLRLATPGSSCVILGGGVLGLEAAAAVARRSVSVTVVEGFEWLLPRQLNRTAAERLAVAAESLGIRLVCGAVVKQFDGDEQVRSVLLETGESIEADLVVVAAGVRSNSYLARQAGLDVRVGIVVDRKLRTTVPDIFAAGDLAEFQGINYGTWAPAQFQGTIAGNNAAGADVSFVGVPRSNTLKVLGVDMFSIGQFTPEDGSYQLFEEKEEEGYSLFLFRDARVTGAILIGSTSSAPAVKRAIEKQTNCTELLATAQSAADIRRGIELL